MSRELLKRALAILNWHGVRRHIDTKLRNEIETYLAQPEPDPVAYGMADTQLGRTHRLMNVQLDKGQEGCTLPLYTTPPDQSARIAELEKQLREETEAHAYVLEQYRLKLAALQAKSDSVVTAQPDSSILDMAKRIERGF